MAFPELCMKKGKWLLAICNYKQPYKNPVFSTKFKLSRNDSLCYSKSIDVYFKPNKFILLERIFFVCVMTLTKAGMYVYNYSDLENHMSSASCTSNFMP